MGVYRTGGPSGVLLHHQETVQVFYFIFSEYGTSATLGRLPTAQVDRTRDLSPRPPVGVQPPWTVSFPTTSHSGTYSLLSLGPRPTPSTDCTLVPSVTRSGSSTLVKSLVDPSTTSQRFCPTPLPRNTCYRTVSRVSGTPVRR